MSTLPTAGARRLILIAALPAGLVATLNRVTDLTGLTVDSGIVDVFVVDVTVGVGSTLSIDELGITVPRNPFLDPNFVPIPASGAGSYRPDPRQRCGLVQRGRGDAGELAGSS
jgi:hypothetical protein